MPRITAEQKHARRSALAREVAFHAGRLANGHSPVAIIVSILQVARDLSVLRPLTDVDLEGAIAAVMTETGARFEDGVMGAQLIVADPTPFDAAVAALRAFVARGDECPTSSNADVYFARQLKEAKRVLAQFPRADER
jgi:hypothetical protein